MRAVTVIDVKGFTVKDNPSSSDWCAVLMVCVLAVSAAGVVLDRQEQAQKTEKGSRLLLMEGLPHQLASHCVRLTQLGHSQPYCAATQYAVRVNACGRKTIMRRRP